MTSADISLDIGFLPAKRAPEGVVARQRDAFAGNSLLTTIVEAMPEGVVILNKERQIVFSNAMFRSVAEEDIEIIGMRPGEALSCEHSRATPAGCGTSQFCRTCGAAKAIKSALNGSKDTQECRIVRKEGSPSGALDLRVVATPFAFDDDEFVAFAVDDISHEKRREVLERIFFHDILNTAGTIYGIAQLLNGLGRPEPAQLREYSSMLQVAVGQLLEEIQEQRQLFLAENGDLYVDLMRIDSACLLAEVKEIYAHHNVAYGKEIRLDANSDNVSLLSDPTLIRRVLGNMTKNALEATQFEGVVTLGCAKVRDGVRFWVHNQGVIPEVVQLQIFKRSFSTKGQGRGLGTYSMKLLTERYLQGRIGLTSNLAEGTTFSAWYPLQPAA